MAEHSDRKKILRIVEITHPHFLLEERILLVTEGNARGLWREGGARYGGQVHDKGDDCNDFVVRY